MPQITAANSVPLMPITIRESRFVGEVIRLCHNTTITTLDGCTVQGKEEARFFNDDVMYHQVAMISLQLRSLTSLTVLEYVVGTVAVAMLLWHPILMRVVFSVCPLKKSGPWERWCWPPIFHTTWR